MKQKIYNLNQGGTTPAKNCLAGETPSRKHADLVLLGDVCARLAPIETKMQVQ